MKLKLAILCLLLVVATFDGSALTVKSTGCANKGYVVSVKLALYAPHGTSVVIVTTKTYDADTAEINAEDSFTNTPTILRAGYSSYPSSSNTGTTAPTAVTLNGNALSSSSSPDIAIPSDNVVTIQCQW